MVNPDADCFAGMTDDEIWAAIDDDTFDEDLLWGAADEELLMMPRVIPLRRAVTWPTLVHEIAAARADVGVTEMIGLAVRAARRERRLSQRELAAGLGVSQASVARLERRAGSMTVGRVQALLAEVGLTLGVLRGERLVTPGDVPAGDLVHRDSSRRRAPAHVDLRRTTSEPRWRPRADGAPTLWTWVRPRT